MVVKDSNPNLILDYFWQKWVIGELGPGQLGKCEFACEPVMVHHEDDDDGNEEDDNGAAHL